MSDNCCSDNKKDFLGGLVLGGVLTAGLYFLFGTQKGKKIQKDLQKTGRETFSNLKDLVEDLEEKGKDLSEKAKEVASDLRDQAEEKFTDSSEIAKTEVTRKLDQALSKIESIQEKGQEITESIHDDLKHRFFKNTPKK